MDEITSTASYAELSASVDATCNEKEKLTTEEIDTLKCFIKYFYSEIPYNNTKIFALQEENRRLREELQGLKNELFDLKMKVNDGNADMRRYISEMSENYVASMVVES